MSALIHAATMVTAGVYMIARSAPLYSRAPEAMGIVALVGVLTALLAGLIALAQRDIKKVLAYSTVSQLGYMFLGVGVGAFAAGIFHLYTHAFFKALLFLGSGSVILAMHHEQDLFRMGGLRKYLPLTWATMLVATLAIAGIPPLAGFFSKDEILWKALTSERGHVLLWLIGVLVAALTAFYMFRLIFLTFYGEERFDTTSQDSGHVAQSSHSTDSAHGHHGPPQEPSRLITVPLLVLALFSVVAGWIGLPAWLGVNRFEEFLEPAFHHVYLEAGNTVHHSHSLEIGLTFLVIALAVGSIFIAYRMFVKEPGIASRLADRFPMTHLLISNKFFVDEAYDFLIVWPIEKVSRVTLWKNIDVGIVDGLVNGTASYAQRWSHRVKRIQSGFARSYASWILFGALLITFYYYLET